MNKEIGTIYGRESYGSIKYKVTKKPFDLWNDTPTPIILTMLILSMAMLVLSVGGLFD